MQNSSEFREFDPFGSDFFLLRVLLTPRITDFLAVLSEAFDEADDALDDEIFRAFGTLNHTFHR